MNAEMILPILTGVAAIAFATFVFIHLSNSVENVRLENAREEEECLANGGRIEPLHRSGDSWLCIGDNPDER